MTKNISKIKNIAIRINNACKISKVGQKVIYAQVIYIILLQSQNRIKRSFHVNICNNLPIDLVFFFCNQVDYTMYFIDATIA